MAQPSECGTAIRVWHGHQSVAQPSECGTAIRVWHGHQSVARPSECGTAIRVWHGHQSVARPSECGTAIRVWHGHQSVARPSECGTAIRVWHGHQSAVHTLGEILCTYCTCSIVVLCFQVLLGHVCCIIFGVYCMMMWYYIATVCPCSGCSEASL